MAGLGAQIGNKNATKSKPWAAAIERALKQRSLIEQKEALDVLAERLLKECDEGNMEALKELGNRLDGKPHQSVGISGHLGLTDLSDDEIERRLHQLADARRKD